MISIDLSGQTALITGASQGLGEATARMLHKAGANVVVNYIDDQSGHHQSLADKIVTDLGERAVALEGNVCCPDQVMAMFDQACEKFGQLNIVVNNAGIVRDSTLKKMTSEQWQAVIDTNLTGVFNVCKLAAERVADGGRIINLASISAVVGFFGQANYAAAKAGVIGLTKVLSKELGKRRITVNAVAPGVVLTEMGRSIPQEVQAMMLKNVPLGRFGEPEEIAGTVLMLCGELAAYITGQTIHVNGGWWG